MRIRALETLEHSGQLRALVREYLAHELTELKRVSGLELDLDVLVANTFDDIDAYLPPTGRLFLAMGEGEKLLGCVFLKRIRPDAGEVKRLYVLPSARGLGLGRSLMEGLLREARHMGARSMLLDTGIYDTEAQELYRKLGFREIGYYPEGENDPELIPYLVYMQLDF
ncbi:GNAT family N-acetyltransferase [Ruegeria aquimaris]|uniref:GNAT family N-acetyltransferase n=1 Tax=Ruegeria aquimaris TaxID=2984333 RepID=A0ABT3AGH7_9RHOB|nr:GNAT family N-acetyltransferase [Ruegeria sp. XHP0148]MCV2887735.1 GNAT family N-acetyltransferase [Ruegeria sp. XHP0148]